MPPQLRESRERLRGALEDAYIPDSASAGPNPRHAARADQFNPLHAAPRLMRIRSTDTLFGLPVLELRRLMRRLSAKSGFGVETVRRILAVSRPAAKRLVADLDRAGYIEAAESPERGSPCWRLTAQGGALAIASAARPIRRATADRLLEQLLDRIDSVNADAGLRYRVADAVVFGSYLGNEPTLGDLDVGIRLESRLPPDADLRAHRKARVALAEQNGRVFRSWFDKLMWPAREVWLGLKSRSHGLSVHDMDDDAIFELADLECRVIYANGRRSHSHSRDRARRASAARPDTTRGADRRRLYGA